MKLGLTRNRIYLGLGCVVVIALPVVIFAVYTASCLIGMNRGRDVSSLAELFKISQIWFPGGTKIVNARHYEYGKASTMAELVFNRESLSSFLNQATLKTSTRYDHDDLYASEGLFPKIGEMRWNLKTVRNYLSYDSVLSGGNTDYILIDLDNPGRVIVYLAVDEGGN